MTTDQKASTDEIQVFEGEQIPVYQQQQKAQIDSQIATAKAYPRDLRKCMENSVVIVTMSEATARSCGYELPRGGKKIKGPSVHFAAILAQNYGNLRAEQRVSEVTPKYVSAEAVAFDLETNYAVKVEVRRKILDRNGVRYNEDMIHTTGLAAAAIAYRNAVLRVIPRAITDKVYEAALNKITGNLSNEQEILKARTEWVKHFKTKYECTDEEILKAVGVRSIQGIGKPEIATLMGMEQSIKDGEFTPDELFDRIQEENRDPEEVKTKGKEFLDDKEPPTGKNAESKDGKLPLGDK